ncbi:MAG: hypothetical protein ACKVKC_08045 [Rhodobacterales bacterium]
MIIVALVLIFEWMRRSQGHAVKLSIICRNNSFNFDNLWLVESDEPSRKK